MGNVRSGSLLATVLALALALPPGAAAGGATGRDVVLPSGFSVTGTVSDTHGNPAVGVDVVLCPTTDDCAGSAVSGASGTFAVKGLVAGSYYLAFNGGQDTNLLDGWYTGEPGGSTDPAHAVAIGVTTNVSGIAIQMADGLRITGHIRNAGGDPIEGVMVDASGYGVAGHGIASDATGYYEIAGMGSGSFTLRASGPDDGSYLSGYVWDGLVKDDFPGTGYSVDGADLTGVDITMEPGFTISGHLSGASGLAVEVNGSPVDMDGSFTIHGLRPGSYGLLFEVPQPSYDPEQQFPYGTYAGDGNILSSPFAPGVEVEVTTADVTGIEAVLPVLPSITGTVRDVSGPVTAAGVQLCDPDNGCAAVHTGPGGTFRAINIPNGSYTIQAGAAHHVTVAYASGRSNPDWAAGIPVVVAGSSIAGIAITLPRGQSISGRVTNAAGVALAGIDVYASPTSGGIWGWGPGGAVTGSTGRYSVTGLKGGLYRVAFAPPEGSAYRGGYWSATGFKLDWSAATTVKVSDTTAPVVGRPVVSYRTGAQIGTSSVPVRVRWVASDAGSNVKANRLQRQISAGSWVTVASPLATSYDTNLGVSSTRTYRFRARATDYSGVSSSNVAGTALRSLLVQQTSKAITWKGAWATVASTDLSGSTQRVARAAGASATYAFTGRAVGWVASVGSGYGQAKVYVDGALAATVDLTSAIGSRRIAWSKAWTSAASHVVRIVAVGTVGHPKVAIDAFTVLR